ncbi:hypothetical protein ACSQ67_016457 [Phaseolus vulgaris]
MKLDEDLRPDREEDFQTDDEENQAQRVFEHLDDDTDSDNSPPSPSLSNEVSMISWPQSYSATPPGLTLLKRFGSVGRSNSLATSFKRSQECQEDSALTLPLVSRHVHSNKRIILLRAHTLQPLSSARFYVEELPPPQEQCSFAKSVINVFPNIYSSMKEPSKFPSVLYTRFAFCGFMYMSVGIMGYLTFGDLVSSRFTLNMPKELYASEIATWTTVVTPLAKYALTLLPIALSIEELATSPRLRCHATSVLIRTSLVILSLLVALYIPYFDSKLFFYNRCGHDIRLYWNIVDLFQK